MSGAIQTHAAIETNQIVEMFIRQMVKISRDPQQVWVGIHNAFAFGDVFDETGIHMSDEDLEEIFKGINAVGKAFNNID